MLLGCSLAGCDRSAPDGGAMLDRGLRYLEGGDAEKAIAAFTESLRVRPDDADAHYNRGLAHVRLGNFDAARTDYTEAIKLRPQFSEAYTNRAVTYARRGQFDEAIADCTEAIRIRPQNALAYRNRGLAYHDKGKYDLALADFNKALDLDSDLAEAYFNRAHTYLKLNRVQDAAADFAQAHRLDRNLDVPAEFRATVSADGPLPSPAPAVAAPPVAAEPASTPPQATVAPEPASAPAPATAPSPGELALDAAADIYRKDGFTVEPASPPETCELLCSRNQIRVRVEVKIVGREGEPLRLTADEVNLAREPSTRTDLVVVLAAAGVAPSPQEKSGQQPTDEKLDVRILARRTNWAPRGAELKPIEFELDGSALQGP
jgi:tetratricopeptide (TPR) repeat protein